MPTLRRLAVLMLLLAPLGAWADDTDIFGGAELNIEPNVLIIFDNSGSMAQEVAEYTVGDYDPNTAYPGPYSVSMSYYKLSGWSYWRDYRSIGADGVVQESEISCSPARSALNAYGLWQGRINAYTYCSARQQDNKRLRTGNYMNYEDYKTKAVRPKINIAKDTIKNLINTTEGVRFGLMVFNSEQGGRVVAPVMTRDDAANVTLLSAVDSLAAETWTPLAETLAEAGLYFAGKPSWANTGSSVPGVMLSGNTYKSPVEWRCQPNYVIIMTDGESTRDRGTVLTRADYMWGLPIRDFDGDKHEPGYANEIYYDSEGSDYLDDVAKFLYDIDLIRGTSDAAGVSFDNSDFPKQHLITYTVGFDINNSLLSETADASHGQGDYFTTKDDLSLSEIFESIIADIVQRTTEFVAPVVPVNRANKTYADNAMYLCVFMPDSSGLWRGNLKKFGLSTAGVILDRDGNPATIATGETGAGSIKDGAHSAWYEVSGPEGLSVDKGGAGQVLLTQATRRFLTSKGTAAPIELAKTETVLTAADFDLSTAGAKDDLLDYVRAEGVYDPDTGSRGRSWVLGDIIHSRPSILQPDPNGNLNIIFVGAGDGFLHCFADDDRGTRLDLTDDSLNEAWAYLPWELAPKLKQLPPTGAAVAVAGDSQHDYFVDANPVVYKAGSAQSYVAFGLRRGGRSYTCLDVSDYQNPTLAWTLAPESLLGTGAPLGQSWVEPRLVNIKAGSNDATGRKAVLLAGGYDTNQDLATPATDLQGRAVYAVDAASGALDTALNFNNVNYPKIDNCIIDLKAFDADDNGFDDTIYAPSLGGEVFVFADRDGDGSWHKREFFNAPATLNKFFCAPAVVQMVWGDFLYLGSGDREHPSETSVRNRFYGLRNTWPSGWEVDNLVLHETDLFDVNSDIFNDGTVSEEQKAVARQNLEAAAGWWFELPFGGEKCVSSALVYDGSVYFTTFTPTLEAAVDGTDKCATGAGAGVARLYRVDYRSGAAVSDLDGDGDKDRSVVLGSGIPSQPVAVAAEERMLLVIAAEKKVMTHDLSTAQTLIPYYWMQI